MKKTCSKCLYDTFQDRISLYIKVCCLIFIFPIHEITYAARSPLKQSISLKLKNAPIEDAVKSLENQVGQSLFFNRLYLDSETTITLDVKEITLSEAVKLIFGEEYTYKHIADRVAIIKGESNLQEDTHFVPSVQEHKMIEIRGIVKDERGSSLPGVTVRIKGTSLGTTTNVDGYFEFKLPEMKGVVLQFSFIGMISVEKNYNGEKELVITLKESVTEMEEVVVKGVFEKKLSSYTGAAVTATSDEIRKVGTLNIIQALSAIDPSIRIAENLEFGSDPNRMPEVTIRGENGFDLRESADEGLYNPNAPLYVLDGIEVSARQVYDMDINRVETITTLKDASATSLYGSRGANGVILITTKTPKAGEIKTTINANFNISTPDLRDYNLMNAAEKVEFEQLAGIWKANEISEQEYRDRELNRRLKEIERGVNTYWLSQPLQTSVNQRYSLFLEGGTSELRYGIDLRYDTDKGVMKGSGRDRMGIGINLNYNFNSKLHLYNVLSVEQVEDKHSPYGNFATYARLNPCDRPYDEEGDLIKSYYGGSVNPLINPQLPNFNEGNNLMVQDRLSLDWWLIKGVRARGSLSYTQNVRESEAFLSPSSVEFRDEDEEEKRGSYSIDNSRNHLVDGSLTLQLSQTYHDKHVLSVGLGSNIQVSKMESNGYTVTGFADENIAFIAAAAQYSENSHPRGLFDKSKLIGFFGNLTYGYDNRYYLDGSYRTDGSSKFGQDSRFAPFWSVGAAWNVHNEQFWDDEQKATLKFRGSVGSTGSVNFSSDQALTVYYYDFENEYNGLYGANLAEYGNPNLKWQNTVTYNIGMDLTLFRNRLQFYVDAYSKTTENLLLSVDVAPSSGFQSYIENVGESRNRGIEARLRVVWLEMNEHDFNWSTTLAAFHNENKILRLSNTLKAMNEAAMKGENNKGTEVLRQYAEGRSQSALMLVESAGIDPGTGKEVFYKLDGTKTFTYDPNDKIIVGDMHPKVEGTIINNINWKGFNLYMLFNYRYGGKIYNGTLATKVEGANPYYNADRRALEERWKKSGDEVFYRDIKDFSTPYQSTRFMFDDNLFSLQSLSASYDLPTKYAKKLGVERLKINFSTTDLFRLSTIKQERGTSYPFARTYTTGLSVTI